MHFQALVTELGDKIEECFAVRDGEDGNTEEGSECGGVSEGEPRRTEPVKATPKRKPAPRRNRRRSSSSPDEVRATRHLALYCYSWTCVKSR